jgi:hypothetical protein
MGDWCYLYGRKFLRAFLGIHGESDLRNLEDLESGSKKWEDLICIE